MECACTVHTDFDKKVLLLSIVHPIARKQHKCGECAEPIQKGDWYTNERWLYDDTFTTHKTCEHCYALRQVFFSGGWYYGDLWSQMWEFIADWDGEVSVSCLKDLTPKARGKVCDLMEEYWDE